MTLRLSDEDARRLRRRAEADGTSMQDVAVTAIQAYLDGRSRAELINDALADTLDGAESPITSPPPGGMRSAAATRHHRRMMLRSRRGAVRAERYLAHQSETGVRDYWDPAGNRGVLVLSRPQGDLVEVTTLSLWDSMDAVRRFAGDDPGQARFYPGDDDLLAEKDAHADHWEVVEMDLAT